LLQSALRQIELSVWRLFGFFLKCMKHVYSFAELGYVKHSMFNSRVDPDLVNSGANTPYWLPIWWFQTQLNKMQAMSNHTTCVFRKGTEIVERRSDPEDGFFIHECSIQLLVYVVNVA